MTNEELKKELSRCLGCKLKPCEKACPLGVSPHDFIAAAKENNFHEAAALIAHKNPLPQTCGLVCPDRFCQKSCIRARMDSAIAIPCLQADIMKRGGYPEINIPPSINKKAAVIGGGPAGLGATYELLINGWQIDIYEQSSALGGAARLIPEYRLPKSVLDFEIARITENDRVCVKLNTKITDFESLKQEYDGIILTLGETMHRTLGIKGEEYCIAYDEYLRNPDLYKGSKIAISGGGEVALDCAITAKQCGCECVEMFVRRRREDMRIMARDQLELERHGIIVRDLCSITNIENNQSTYNLCTIKNKISPAGKAEPCNGTEQTLNSYDILIQALGSYYPKENIPEGFIIAGNMNGTGKTIVEALSSGRVAARRLLNGEI